ncbi:glycine--tRNA ligase subunit beta [Synechococcus sp. RSCCF101]|uniref:glycine--tRNA ligase subunit beta n=1 Tax=Synechococcus sp. RSCCF101 TaxID=2511069 RepID=UPI0012466B90|nr:glycine--tRNA ligase subunit beta [Synechococcus sp. RSCCF101]QEY31612.1 glycine--tRNA ligase subunit beta [Synechococcus sp. RSCCF101]
MATFLLEIGTEELPADFARLALPQLQHLAERDLQEARLAHAGIEALGTPRRLALLVEGLPDRQPDLEEERKGPPAGAAFRDGQPTRAAEGFARRCGLTPAELEIRPTDKGEFVFARVKEPGRPTSELLASLIPAWIAGLQGRRFMRWGAGDLRFSRPIRWLVALLDGDVIPVQLEGSDPPVESGRLSRGHRLHPKAVAIAEPAAYRSTLAAAGVVVDRAERERRIHEALAQSTEAAGLTPDLPAALNDELVDLVEDPMVLEGSIPSRFLELPPELLTTVMRSHQRYVPLFLAGGQRDPLALAAGDCVSERFLFVASGLPGAADGIRRGNERVLTARLADAAFFLAADQAVPSIDRRDQLARVTFAAGLGSLLDRVERLEWITDVLIELLPLTPEDAVAARRAAHLCKHDLVSQMVGEFPELQGVIGAKYLLAEGESRPVALAVLEHYRPRGAGDALPGTPAGAVLAVAERLELLLSVYAKGERPRGSSDPYALRRAGNGVVQILWSMGWRLDLGAALERMSRHWQSLLPGLPLLGSPLARAIAEDLLQRVGTLLEDGGLDGDIVQAVAGRAGDDGSDPTLARPLKDVGDARARAQLLQDLRRQGQLAAVQAVVQRAANLAARAEPGSDAIQPEGLVDPGLFESVAESEMLTTLQRLAPLAQAEGVTSYARLASGLISSAPVLASFFDGENSVMVMCDDATRRRNRLHLLSVLRNQAARLGDFTALQADSTERT